ncbi:hypothetical protein AB0M48_35250 [Lentzea sp. NPDC051208]|uniref:hypothetical protein n=1 Tax=Lentzea sp. NPDC051208 TaxID=3154642 RepID=UPI00343A0F6A
MPDLHLEHAPGELPRSRSSRRSGLVVISVLVVVVLGAGVWWMVGRPRSNDPASQPSGSCIGVVAAKSDRHCLQQAQDIAKRAPITEVQRADAESRMQDLDRVIHRVGLCLDASGNPCPGAAAKRPPTAAEADAARQRLKDAGFGDSSVVRVADETDPAPVGSLFYVAEMPAGACVIGHIIEVPGGAGARVVAGKLPSGGCAEV